MLTQQNRWQPGVGGDGGGGSSYWLVVSWLQEMTA
eukprot:gene5513-7195_t